MINSDVTNEGAFVNKEETKEKLVETKVNYFM